MPMRCHSLVSVVGGLLLIIATFLLQLIALATPWWATFVARTDLGKPKEDGHYGLWSICSIKGPRWMDDCDPLDTFFQVSSYLHVSSVMAIIHLLILLALFIVALICSLQIFRNISQICLLKTKTLLFAKVLLAFISVIFAIFVAIFSSLGENRQAEYTLRKGWSFWIQISVIVVDAINTILCVVENFRFWKEHIKQNVDPGGTRAETYGNPTFDADSPETSRRRNVSNGAIACTETSAHPYDPDVVINDPTYRNYLYPKQNGMKNGEPSSQPGKGKKTSASLSYENECYQEHSPSTRRMRQNL